VTALRPRRRRSAFADRLLEFPDLVLSDGREFARRGAWRAFFAHRLGGAAGFDGRLVVEIGCHDAALLARVAAKHPHTAFVGIDWKCRALHVAAGCLAAAGLRNVALLHGRGQDVGLMFAAGEVDEVWLFHPDPCDRPRERPNRLFAEPFLRDAAAVLRSAGSLLVLKTDHREYYETASALAATPSVGEHFNVSARSADLWADRAVLAHVAGRCFAGEATPFEERFRRKRKPIHYLELCRR
jgi:tRNA (guanine-N7-)-methyltransferase